MNELTTKPTKLPRILPRYHKFTKAFLSGMSLTKSAIEAGYSPKSAHNSAYRLMNNVGIKAHIAYHQQLANEELQITLKDVVPPLRSIIKEEISTRPHVVVSACGELAKIGRLYEPTVVNNIVVNHNALTVVHAPGAMEAIEEERTKAEAQDH